MGLFFDCVVSACCLCFSISHRSWNHISIQRNLHDARIKNKHVQPLACVLASIHLRYNLCLDISDEISETGGMSASTLRLLPFAEQRSAPARGGADTRHFARISKLLRSAVLRRRLKIKICRWPWRAALVPPDLAEIYPSDDVCGGRSSAEVTLEQSMEDDLSEGWERSTVSNSVDPSFCRLWLRSALFVLPNSEWWVEETRQNCHFRVELSF